MNTIIIARFCRLVGLDDACDTSSVASSTSSVATEHSGGEQSYVGGTNYFHSATLIRKFHLYQLTVIKEDHRLFS